MEPLYSKLDVLNSKKGLKDARKEAEKLFHHRAGKLGFDDKQAHFMWNYVISGETRKKLMNIVTNVQTEQEVRM